MFESDNNMESHASQGRMADFRRLAAEALQAGDDSRAAHLFLLAYEDAPAGLRTPDPAAIDCLRSAWDAAIRLKDRALAEYVFDKLEPYFSAEETAQLAEALQRLAIDKLAEFGLSRDVLQEMADQVSADFFNVAGLMKVMPGEDGKMAPSLASPTQDFSTPPVLAGVEKPQSPDAVQEELVDPSQPTYRDLVGYTHAIEIMRNRGIGLGDDVKFSDFLKMLQRRHGIDTAASVDSLLFRCQSRADALRFMAATAGELNAPIVRMYMEESPQGFPVLCVSSNVDFRDRRYFGARGFAGTGVLLLEDVDLWGEPMSGFDEFDQISYAQLSRGAREAIMLIRSAVENPEVAVMASCSAAMPLDEFFLDVLEPLVVIDIDQPDEGERAQVWRDVARMYPSVRFVNQAELVRLSANLSREDIYLAAREAVEQAYGMSIEQRSFVPVTAENLLDKIAAFQPLDSAEYKEIEESAVAKLRSSFDDIEQLLGGEEG